MSTSRMIPKAGTRKPPPDGPNPTSGHGVDDQPRRSRVPVFNWVEVVAFRVNAKPEPRGSKKPGFTATTITGRRYTTIVDDNPKSRAWIDRVRTLAKVAMIGRRIIRGSVRIEAVFYLPRPKSHKGAGRNADTLKPSAPYDHVIRPDLDKIERGTLDGMSKAVWCDDAQITDKFTFKRYDDGEGVGVEITVYKKDIER